RVRGTNRTADWPALLNLLLTQRYRADDNVVDQLTNSGGQVAVISAIKNNLVPPVAILHDPNSNMLEGIKYHLRKGRVVIVDISLFSSTHGRWISDIILNDLFNDNQENFIEGSKKMIPITAVIEEAQAVL